MASSTNHIRNVAIVGAGGQVGKFMVAAMLEKKTFNITAISRADSKSSPADGVKVVAVDYDKPDTIVSALKGQDVLIITMSVKAPPEQSNILVEAAAKAGVPWILPNEFGGDTDAKAAKDILIGPAKQEIRKRIDDLAVSSWIAVATGFWYEYSLSGPGAFGIDIATKEVVFFDDGTQRISTTTFPQIGRAVANLLSLPIDALGGAGDSASLSSYRNRFVVPSSFVVNQKEMFESIKRVTNTTDADWKISSIPAKERFEASKKSMQEGNRLGFLYLLYTRYFFPGENAGLPHEIANEALNLPKEDLDEWTKEAVRMSENKYWAGLFS